MSSTPSMVAQHAFRFPDLSRPPDPLDLLQQFSPATTPVSAVSRSPGPLGDVLNTPHLELVVTTVLPAAAALLGLAFDLLSRVPYPKSVRRAARTLTIPFRNFFTLDDVEAPTPCPLHRAPWKARALVLGSVVQSVGWLAVLAYKQEVGEWHGSVRAGVAFLAWVRASPPRRCSEQRHIH